MELRRAEAPLTTTPGRHLLFAFIGWGVFLYYLAVFLPPVDSYVLPSRLLLWSVVSGTALLTLYTSVAISIYLYQSWLKWPTVPNKVSYGVWVGLECLVLLVVEYGAVYLLLNMLYGIQYR